jgi:hypothetical protein
VHHPDWLWLLIGALVIGTVAVSFAMDRRDSGDHGWAPGAAYRAPVGDHAAVTRHVERPGEDSIRVKDLVARIAGQHGRHALIENPSAVDEGQGDEGRGDEGQGDEGADPAVTQPPLFTHETLAS